MSSTSTSPAYGSGRGLGHTRFEWSALEVAIGETDTDGSFRIAFEVANTGERPGREVVQFCLHDPVASVVQPVQRLVGYRRVPLAAGERRRIPDDGPAAPDRPGPGGRPHPPPASGHRRRARLTPCQAPTAARSLCSPSQPLRSRTQRGRPCAPTCPRPNYGGTAAARPNRTTSTPTGRYAEPKDLAVRRYNAHEAG